MNSQIVSLKKQIRSLIIFFMAALILSGATAIPVEPELRLFISFLPGNGPLSGLLSKVLQAVLRTNESFPFLFYGYDWLAFAHFVIAVAFIGPLRNPLKNIWVIEYGLIACVMVIPFALIAGGLRELPLWWRLIDCSFGIIGFIPLWVCRMRILTLQKLLEEEKLNLIF